MATLCAWPACKSHGCVDCSEAVDMRDDLDYGDLDDEPRDPPEFGVTWHELKCWPEPFEQMSSGAKTAEFRRDDRGFAVGDMLLLREWHPGTKEFTCRVHRCGPITAITRGFGIPDGFVMLSLSRPALAGDTERGA